MPPVSPRFMFWAVTGATVASFGWMISLAQQTQDWLAFAILFIATIVLIAWAYRRLKGQDVLGRYKFSLRYVAAIAIVTLLMLNWRFHQWLAEVKHESIEQVRRNVPYWSLNLLIVVVWSAVLGSIYSTMRTRNRAV